MNLRSYQSDCVERVLALLGLGHRVCVVAPTGSGKTVIGEALCFRESGVTLWLTHTKELVAQTARRLSAAGLKVGIIASGYLEERGCQVYVSSIQTLVERNYFPLCDSIIIDECFPAGTLVDGRPIETLLVGDEVVCYNHQNAACETRKVTRVFKSKPSALVKVRFSSGRSFVCTPGHPVYIVEDGYSPACLLEAGDLCHVQRSGGGLREGAKDVLGGVHQESRFRGNGGHESSPRFAADEETQPNAPSGYQETGLGYLEADPSWAEGSRREWRGADSGGGNVIDSVEQDGLCRALRGEDRGGTRLRVPDQLQTGPGEPSLAGSDRGRRLLPHRAGETGTGPEEAGVLGVDRVDSVEILECGGDGTFGGMCPDGFVYNLEVEGNHNYFAEGVLVHNCHHFVSEQWGSFLGAYPFTRRIGLTATPERADGRPLGDIFDELVVAAHYSELTDQGHLVPVRILRPAMELDRGLALDAVEAYLTKGDGRQGFIYCKSVELAYEVAEILRSHGIEAQCIEADTPKDVRAKFLERFARGEIRILTNMMALTEGIDVPAASLCIIARNMGHVSMYLQSAGRVMRPSDGKKDCLLIDLPGLSHRFGPPNENRIYSLDGEAIKRNPEASLRVCLGCGFTFVPGAVGQCPRCGGKNPVMKPKPLRIYNEQLHELFNGPGTPEWVKKSELARLERLARERGFNDAWVARQFKAAFMELPTAWAATDDRKRAEYRRLLDLSKRKGYKDGFAANRYKATYGSFPPRSWGREEEKQGERTNDDQG